MLLYPLPISSLQNLRDRSCMMIDERAAATPVVDIALETDNK
ncbi:hypothetical protein [Nostoc sp.]